MTRRGLRIALVLAFAAIAVGPAAAARAGQSPAKLPDLAMLAPFDFTIDTEEIPGRRLLRFSTVQVNVGPGPFRLYGFDADGTADQGDLLSVVQWIRREDGSWTERATSARMSWSFDDGHDHWHLLDFQKFKLVSLDTEVLGNVAKIGFCAFDSYPYTSFKTAFYTSNRTCQTRSSGKVLMGTSRGWGDIYRASIAFQWIDITDLPNGDYKVRVVVDPPLASDGLFRESDESNNRAWTRVHIGTSNVTMLDQSRDP